MKQKKTLPITVKVTKDHDGQVTEFREQRGIRDERFAIGDSPFSSAYGKFGEMVAGAESLLREAGETTGVEAMDGFLGSERNKALVDWSTGVMLRNGSTTPVGCAVSFLFAAHILTLKLNDGATQRSTDLFHLILEFCSAWHWLHMELYGEHDLAFDGKVSKESLSKGAVAVHARKQRKDDAIYGAISEVIGQPASEIADCRFKTVNAALAKLELGQFQTKTALWKAVQRLKRARR